MTDSAGAVSALGGSLALLAGDTVSELSTGPAVLVSQVGATAIASWAVLHLALVRWTAASFTTLTLDSSAPGNQPQ